MGDLDGVTTKNGKHDPTCNKPSTLLLYNGLFLILIGILNLELWKHMPAMCPQLVHLSKVKGYLFALRFVNNPTEQLWIFALK